MSLQISLRVWAAACTLCLLAAQCVAQTAQRAMPSQPAPAEAATPQGNTLGRVGEGRRLFLKLNCYGCHGMYATGGMGPNIVHADTDTVRAAVLGGRAGGMPSFAAYVNDRDIRRLAAYLQSIGSTVEPKFKDWWEDVPPK